MALLTDDPDFNSNSIRMDLGGNGDYYLQLWRKDEEGLNHFDSVRISTSGGNAPTDVKIAIAELWRALEKHGLNEYPD